MSWQSRNLFNRRFSLNLNHEDAYVSGYFGVKFILNENTRQAIDQSASFNAKENKLWDASNVDRALGALCEGVTSIPGGTLNVAIMTGMGGPKWGAPSNIEFGDEATLRFRELSGMTIRDIFASWTNVIRNSNTGLSQLRTVGGSEDTEYTKLNFSGDILYWTTKPNGRDVETAFYLSGCYPTSSLQSQIATDLTTVDGQTFDVNFHVDTLNWDHECVALAKEAIEEFTNATDEYYQYGGNGSGCGGSGGPQSS